MCMVPAMVRKPDPILAALRREPAKAKRSPLSRVVRERFADLAEMFGNEPVDWTHVARILGEHGTLDRDGKPPSANATRKAFARERQARQQARQQAVVRKPHIAAQPKPGEIAPGVRPVMDQATPSPSIAHPLTIQAPSNLPSLASDRPMMPALKIRNPK